jgi:YD repeat-containing protein
MAFLGKAQGWAWYVAAAFLALIALLSTPTISYAEQATRQVWIGRYPFNAQAEQDNVVTSTHEAAFSSAEQRMRADMLRVYGFCAPPAISFLREDDLTTTTGLIYYGVPYWRVSYLDLTGVNCTHTSVTETRAEIYSRAVPFETGPTEERTCKTTNPVQPGSGRKRFTETDYTGAGAHPLTLTRHYSSRWTDGAVVTGVAPIAAWDGGWRHSYQASLTPRADGSLRAWRTDGTMLGFTASTTVANTWTAIGSRDTVTALVDAVGQRTGYTLTAASDDSAETYDATGKLLGIRQRNGWLTTLTYSDATTPAAIAPRPGLLISVKNHFARELKFTYDAQGRIAEVLPPGTIAGQTAGSAISPIRYVYDEAASLGAGVPAQSQLSSIVWQDGSVRRYHHEDGRWLQAVTGITDEAGVRYGTYAYDAQGRVTRSELSGGAERLDFAYTTDANGKPTTTVTDYTGAGGAATARTYTFTDIGNVRYPSNLTAPCSLCGSTQQSSTYDANGNPTRQIAHDGSVTFIAYDARGRETERATFPSSYQSATTRPALSAATKVISTKWHATFNLPTQVAEPNKTTANTYNAKGMLTGQSWTATTDATGAAKFTAVKTGSTYATGWSYSASSLITTAISKVDAVETQRYTMTYAANGDLTKITDVTAGNRIGRATSYDAQGRLLQATTIYGDAMSFVYSPRGFVTSRTEAGKTTTFVQNAIGYTREVRMPDGKVATFEIDSTRRLRAVRIDGALISANAIRDGALLSPFLAQFLEQLQRGVQAVVPPAQAQAGVVVDLPLPWPVPGQPQIGQPQGDPEDNLIGQAITGGSSKFGKKDQALRRLLEGITAMCTCDPNGGYNSPKLTPTAYAHISITGHLSNVFGNKSYFIEPVSQTMVDEIARHPQRVVTQVPGNQTQYLVRDFGRDVGLTRMEDPANPSGPRIFVPTRTVTMFVSNDNCDALIRKRNEVVTMHPGEPR